MNGLLLSTRFLFLLFALSALASNSLASEVLDAAPDTASQTDRYLFFMHGKIVEKKGIPAKSKEYGPYDYKGILNAFSKKGLTVISEVRRKDTDIYEFATKIAEQVRALLDKGVPASHITVSGFSKGGRMTAVVSSLLANNEISYVVLAGCRDDDISQYNLRLRGRVLSIYDRGDDKFGSCSSLFATGGENLVSEEIVLTLGKGHGAFYSPRKEWLEPMTDWAMQQE